MPYTNQYIQLSENFQSSINPVLEELINIAKENGKPPVYTDYLHQPIIKGKIHLLLKLLNMLREDGVSIALLHQAKDIIKALDQNLTYYFREYKSATCFAFSNPENAKKMEEAMEALTQYSLLEKNIHRWNFYICFCDYTVEGFPPDCDYKFYGSVDNNQIKVIGPLKCPVDETDSNLGNQISSSRTREEHQKKVADFIASNQDFYSKILNDTRADFLNFCKKVETSNQQLFEDIKLVLNKIDTITAEDLSSNLILDKKHIKRLFDLLYAEKYIRVSYPIFETIFSEEYAEGQNSKIEWLGSGPRLKYFIDQLDGKFHISKINVWANQRFHKKGVKNLATYLRKKTSEIDYIELREKNNPKDPMNNLFSK